MSKFSFKKSAEKHQPTTTIESGVHVATITQSADIGLQLPFHRDNDPEEQMAVAFELESGDLIAKRMKFSDHPASTCFALFASAYPDLDGPDTDELELGLPDLLGKSVLIEVEIRDGKWPRVTAITALEEGFEAIQPKSKLMSFDAEEMDRDVYLKLHRDIRSWVSKRVRHS